MNLDRVTITGADDTTSIRDLEHLSDEFPFVEWGILVSTSHTGTPRFPGGDWIEELRRVQERRSSDTGIGPLKLSLHVCGRVVRDLVLCDRAMPPGIARGFQRLQLNFHREHFAMRHVATFAEMLGMAGVPEVIFQLDGAKGLGHYLDAASWSRAAKGQAFVPYPLFDASGGAGVVPTAWPEAAFPDPVHPMQRHYHGYAGGLGPENLASELERIAAAADGARFWVDMETRVRLPDDSALDIGKVRRCLQIAKPHVTR